MERSRYKIPIRIIAPHRLLALADGVFAIVMTILVLELGVPIVTGASVNTELTHALQEMWPELVIYVLSFLILGIFWLFHHFVFDSVRQYDSTLSWINIFFLMCTALIPFSTSLVGKYGAEQITAIAYGINMFLGFLGLLALWVYATGKRRLVDADIDPGVIKGGSMMGIAYLGATLIGILVSFFIPAISFALYALIALAVIVITAVGKVELVVMLPIGDRNFEQSMPEDNNK